MNLDLEKKNKTKKIILKKTLTAIVVSNLFQLSLHLLLKEDTGPHETNATKVEKGLVVISIAPKLFVPRHTEGKQVVSLVSRDQKDIIPKAYLYPVPSADLSNDSDNVSIEVPEKFLDKIIKRKSDWEVYPFTGKIKKKGRTPLRNRYEILF